MFVDSVVREYVVVVDAVVFLIIYTHVWLFTDVYITYYAEEYEDI